MQTTKTSPHHVRKRLLKCPEAYVESVGKTDIETLGVAVDAPDGKGTVLRLILGATACMPLRALGYVDSAARIARIIPCEQVQVVHANHLGSSVNDVALEDAHRQAQLLASLATVHLEACLSDIAPKVLHAEDEPIDLEPFLPFACDAVLGRELRNVLQQKGAKHGGNADVYAAAHVAFQDTDRLTLSPLGSGQPEQIAAERIISIGCQQERTFYAARMAVRSVISPPELIASAQIFTKHVTPPYFMARDGEQTLEDALMNGVDMSRATDRSAHRDLAHLQQLILEGANHG